MGRLDQKITLRDACNLIGKSKDIFSPIKEAITNSLDAITQKQKLNESFIPLISLRIYFRTSKDLLEKETHTLDFISIEDNGLGFTSENLARFKKLAENTKGLKNRGTGKIQLFSRFNKISIDSTFNEDGEINKLNASWNIDGEYSEDLKETETQATSKTTVKMSDFSGDTDEKTFFLRYLDDINELKHDILKRFLLRLWLGATQKSLSLRIQTFLETEQKEEFTFNQSTVPEPDKEEKIFISAEQMRITEDEENKDKMQIDWIPVEPKHELVIHRFKMSKDDIDENGIYMCSKGILVESFKFQNIRKNGNFNGYRYVSSVSGDLLDDPSNVNQSVDGFKFPSKKQTEKNFRNGDRLFDNPKEKYVFWDEIKNKIGEGLAKAYSDIENIQKELETKTLSLARQYGISPEDAEAAKIILSDTEEEATEKLFKAQAQSLAKKSIEIKNTYRELKRLSTPTLDPRSEEYRTQFTELSNRLLKQIPQQNKDELARYVIRRDMVVDLLKLALQNNLDVQKEWQAKKDAGETARQEQEGIIHDIISKRRMKGIPNDLWILNEEFVHFDGYSEAELNKIEINGEKLLRPDVDIDAALKSVGIDTGSTLKWRPDIFLYPEEGKCILIEFKAPDVELTQYCDQIQKYAKIIANYSTIKITQFYGFLIGEKINLAAMPDRYKKVPYGNYWVYASEPINSLDTHTPIADIYQEIIPLSEISKRAEIRNKSFAGKLGITETDLREIREEGNPPT